MKPITLALLLASTCAVAQSPAVTKNIMDYSRECSGLKSPVCHESFSKAIGDAKSFLSKHGDQTYTISIPAGTFDFSEEPHANADAGIIRAQAAIALADIAPKDGGRLIIQGAGKDKTTLITSDHIEGIHGDHVSHITIAGITFARPHIDVTQGVIVDATHAGQLTVDVPDGFPAPASIFSPGNENGTYIRVFTNAPDPQLVLTATNSQISWGASGVPKAAGPGAGGSHRWIIYFNKPDQMPGPDYLPGQLACIKSKNSGQAYMFSDGPGGGSDIVFDDIRWTQESRGAFKGGIVGIKILNSEVDRPPAIHGQQFCLSTPDGGPQIGQPGSLPTHGNLVDNYTADHTGDDSLAFFGDDSVAGTPNASIVRNVKINNSFAREILMADTCSVTVTNADIKGCGPELPECPVTHLNGACGVPWGKHKQQTEKLQQQLKKQ